MGRARPVASDPDPDPNPTDPNGAESHQLRLVAMREHSLLSLFELSQELSVVLDTAGLADLALFNLMGHLGTSQAVLLLESGSRPGSLETVKCHGVRREVATALAAALEDVLPECPTRFPKPLRIRDAVAVVTQPATDLAERSGIALMAPLFAGSRAIGFVVLGHRARGQEFTDLDLAVLSASLGMIGVAFENRRLYSRLEEQNRSLAHANQELRELDRLKSEFVQNVNHELRTPLAVIVGCVDCLMQEPDGDPRRRRFLTGVMEQAGKLRDMVQMMLDFTATLDGSLEVSLTTFDPRVAISELFEDRREAIRATHPDFTLAIEPGTAGVLCDRARTQQVVAMLLDNAVKFTPPATPIELRVCERVEDAAWLRVEVIDRGPGIPPEQVELLFKPFQQGDGSLTRKVGGLGMGLATAGRIAERMGCRMLVESHPGRGSKFALLLPRLMRG